MQLGRALVIALPLVSGCFVELGGGYYPAIHQTLTDTVANTTVASSGSGWMASIWVGFFADVVLDELGFALGWSPFGTHLAIAKEPQHAAAGGGEMFRADLVLPPSILGSDTIRPRVVTEYNYYTTTGFRATGSDSYTDRGTGGGNRLFLGVGLSHTAEWGSQLIQFGVDHDSVHTPEYFSKVAGEEHDPAIETSAWGVSASITISVLPASHPNGIVDYTHEIIHTSPGAGVCEPEVCDKTTHRCTQICHPANPGS